MVLQQWQVKLADTVATHQLGTRLGQWLSPGQVLLLQGDLGSGKTTLVQGIGTGLGIQDPIVSPTFILLNEYLEGRIPLYHADLYRLSPLEVEALQLERYWDGVEVTPGVVAIEWPDRLSYKPASYLNIHLSYGDNGQRQATIELVGTAFPALNQLMTSICTAN